MPQPYSLDLRARVLRAVDAGDSTHIEVAARFEISERTLYHWLRLRRQSGSIEPRAHGGGRQPSVDASGAEVLRELVDEQNDLTLEEYSVLYRKQTGAKVSVSALKRALKRLGITRKKDAPRQRAGPSGRESRTRSVRRSGPEAGSTGSDLHR